MSEKLRESLSAAMDGEADEFELRRVLDEVAKNPALAAVWQRFHLVGAHLRGETSPRGGRDAMADRVWAALETPEEAAEEKASAAASDQPPQRRWLGPLTGTAVAAGVALAVVFGLNGFETEGPPTPEIAQAAPTNLIDPAVEVSAEDIARSNAYMMRHVQHTAMNRSGVISFSKVATYQQP